MARVLKTRPGTPSPRRSLLAAGRDAAMPTDVPDGRDGTALAGLRVALERAGYTAERVEERLGTHELSSRPIDTAVHLRRVDGSDSFSTLARLFLLGDDVEVERIEEAVAPLWTEQLAALGLVAAAD